MRLIDADALYKSFGASGNCNNCPNDAYKCQNYNEHTLMEFCERIEDAPTVDAVEVVRCKDCKYKQGSACDYSAVWVRPNGFCQWGERKDDVSDICVGKMEVEE